MSALPKTHAQPKQFTVRNMAPRDELVLRSHMRMLRNGLDAAWQYTDELDADLLILGDGSGEWSEAMRADSPDNLLRVAVFRSAGDTHFVQLPIVFRDLRQALEKILKQTATPESTLVAATSDERPPLSLVSPVAPVEQPEAAGAARVLAAPAPALANSPMPSPFPAPAAAYVAPPARPPHSVWGHGRMHKLTRWPRSAVFRGKPHFAKVAAAALAQAASDNDLALSTGTELADVREFLDRAHADGSLRTVSEELAMRPAQWQPANESIAAAHQPINTDILPDLVLGGSLARASSGPIIVARGASAQRLEEAAQQAAANLQAAARRPSGLFSRIRAKLGI